MTLAFRLTIFVGAFLLFQIQPIIGKFILPWFGGGPGVWTTCMLFFQLLLLGGYAYAHVLSRHFAPRKQVITHIALIGAALALLPITPSYSSKPQDGGDPQLQILLLLTTSVGLPYLVLSATGPLMQQWFSRVRPSDSPYWLYALSNAGSLLALLSYPLVFEIYLSRGTQTSFWAAGLAVFAVSCCICASSIWRASSSISSMTSFPANPKAESVSWLTKVLWLALPACASTLLLASTNKICQDVAVIPLLWVLPLAIYLLSFIISFDNSRWYRRVPYAGLLVLALAVICWYLCSTEPIPLRLQLMAYCGGLFVCCMVCHGELYLLRPSSSHLTAFYLMIATGGAVGGLFVNLVAPILFNDFYELHLGLVLCTVFFLVAWMHNPQPGRFGALSLVGRSVGIAVAIILSVLLWAHSRKDAASIIEQTRNFYGVLTLLREDPSQSGLSCLKLMHGGTAHGFQLADPALRRVPTSYYGEGSGVGRALAARSGQARRIGIIGLGAGTLAAYAHVGDTLRIYEINPEVIRMAKSSLSYLSDCAGSIEIVSGDARLSLDSEPSQNFDLLVIDAFSSDAIPIHLLTREAFALYQRHLKPNGVIAIHISNRYLDLEPVVVNAGQHMNWHSLLIKNEVPKDKWWLLFSIWIVMSSDEEFLRSPAIQAFASEAVSNPKDIPLWTDDYASLYPILLTQSVTKPTPRPAEARTAIGATLAQRGDFAGAIARYRSALEIEPNFIDALNDFAWLLATAPDAAVRNGDEAVRLGEQACQLTEYRRTILLGTLAAAYAEAGRYPDAIAMAERACKLASESGETVLLTRNQQLLELYRTGKPYHELPMRPVGPD